jgi:hypothetical protein
MTLKEQRAMRQYCEKAGYNAYGVHDPHTNSYGLHIQPIGIILWTATGIKQTIDDKKREASQYQ